VPKQAVTAAADNKNRTNDLGMEFVWIPGMSGGGGFIGKYEVTQKQFRAVTGNLPSEQIAQGDDLPVANLTLAQAKDFCDRLSKKDGKHYAVPSKEDWLAAAGLSPEQQASAWAVLLDKGMLQKEVTSYKITPLSQPARVGSRGSQTNGLSDMFGNVREWVTSNESAGFSYDTEGVGQRKLLFVTGDKWNSITGFRCLLRDGN
jgi:formylglycine-generating enzyme required for sulfatase activity